MGRADAGAALCGFVLLDKPAGWTSHDVVARVRRVLGVRRVGHAGTLDPMATGVLVLGVGRATRLLGLISDADKTYEATMRLGLATTTDDIEGEPLATTPTGLVGTGESAAPTGLVGVGESATPTGLVGFGELASPTRLVGADERATPPRMVGAGELTAAMAALTGDILQRPSSVSAVKVAGQRAHARVRAGEQVELPARPVRVTQFDLLALRPGPDDTVEADVVVRCGSGTYVRALARDVGEALGVGGCLSALRRTEAAGVPVAECRTVADFAADPQLVPVAQVIGHTLQVVAVPPASVVEFSHGRQAPDPRAAWTGDGTPREPVAGATGGVAREPVAGATGGSARVAVAGPTGEVAGVARAEGGMLLPDVVLVEPVMGATQ